MFVKAFQINTFSFYLVGVFLYNEAVYDITYYKSSHVIPLAVPPEN